MYRAPAVLARWRSAAHVASPGTCGPGSNAKGCGNEAAAFEGLASNKQVRCSARAMRPAADATGHAHSHASAQRAPPKMCARPVKRAWVRSSALDPPMRMIGDGPRRENTRLQRSLL
jgi:hypothetical protein